jgi:hypothetical protein
MSSCDRERSALRSAGASPPREAGGGVGMTVRSVIRQEGSVWETTWRSIVWNDSRDAPGS